MMCSANFPDDMVSVINHLPWMALIIYGFLVLTFLLLCNLMLACVNNTYQDNMKSRLEAFYTARTIGVAKSFKALAVQGDRGLVIEKQTFKNLIQTLSTSPGLKGSLRPDNADVLFAALDDDESVDLTNDGCYDTC